MVRRSVAAFTLAEVLITLAITAIIAAFAAPKLLSLDSQNTRYSRMANNTAAALVLALDAHRLSGNLNATTTPADLTQYINYIKADTASTLDSFPTDSPATRACGGTYQCLRLHNGAILQYNPAVYYDGTATTNAIWFALDPDGQVTSGGNGKTVVLFLYYTGQVRSFGTIYSNTTEHGWSYASACSACEPSWFTWE